MSNDDQSIHFLRTLARNPDTDGHPDAPDTQFQVSSPVKLTQSVGSLRKRLTHTGSGTTTRSSTSSTTSSSHQQRRQRPESTMLPFRRPKKRTKTIARCSSPSHFLVSPEEERTYGAQFADQPARQKLDKVLKATSARYHTMREVQGNSVVVDAAYDTLQYPTVDLLLSPLAKPNPLDVWSFKEIALFEVGMTRFGKDFHTIQKLIPSKTVNQLVDFYYKVWKFSSHYKMWKQNREVSSSCHPAFTYLSPTTYPQLVLAARFADPAGPHLTLDVSFAPPIATLPGAEPAGPAGGAPAGSSSSERAYSPLEAAAVQTPLHTLLGARWTLHPFLQYRPEDSLSPSSSSSSSSLSSSSSSSSSTSSSTSSASSSSSDASSGSSTALTAAQKAIKKKAARLDLVMTCPGANARRACSKQFTSYKSLTNHMKISHAGQAMPPVEAFLQQDSSSNSSGRAKGDKNGSKAEKLGKPNSSAP
eukprot:g31018.t1